MERSTEPRFSGDDMDPNQAPSHTPSPANSARHSYGAPFQLPRNNRAHPHPSQWHHPRSGAYPQPNAGPNGNNFRGPAFFEEEGDMHAIPDNQRFMPNRYIPNPFQQGSPIGGPQNGHPHRGFSNHGLPPAGYFNDLRYFNNMPRNPSYYDPHGGSHIGSHSAPRSLGYQHHGQDSPPPYDDQQPQPYDGADDVESERNYRGSDPDWNEGEGHQSDGGESEFVASGENAEENDEMDGDEEKPSKQTWDYVMEPQHDTKYAGLIKDLAGYVKEKDRRRTDDIKGKDGDEWNMPRNDVDMRKHVESLFKAIKNLKGIWDQPTAGGHPAQAVARIKAGYYPDDYLELICWEILLSCMDSSKEHHLVRSFHKTKYEDNEAIGGFVGRIERVRNALEKSKAVCKQVLDPSYLHRLCDAPGAELQMKEANRKLNSVRDRQNKIGREVIKTGALDKATLKGIKDLHVKTPASNNKRRPSAPRSKSAKKPEKTLVTPLKSPAKRKLASGRSATKIKYESEDSDEDAYSDEEFNTPSKRRGTGNRGPGAPRNRNTTTPRKSANGSTPSKRPPRAAAVAADENRRKALKEVDESERSEFSQTPAPVLTKEEIAVKAQEQRALGSVDDSIEDKETRYKLTICDILGVDIRYADQLDLQDLRTYARAFNGNFNNDVWIVPNSNGARGVGPVVFTADQAPGEDGLHIALAIDRFKDIAVARGDLDEDFKFNPFGQKLFSSGGNVEIDRALGVLENEFGRFAAPDDHE